MHDIPVPRVALLACLALILGAFGAIGVGRLAGASTSPLPLAPVVASLDLTFADRPDGAVLALDGDGSVRAVVAPETGAFVRGVLRALVRGRTQNGIGADGGAFRLNRLADGHLTITDPATGETIDLGAFGPTNQAAFAEIMTPGRSRTPSEAAL